MENLPLLTKFMVLETCTFLLGKNVLTQKTINLSWIKIKIDLKHQ